MKLMNKKGVSLTHKKLTGPSYTMSSYREQSLGVLSWVMLNGILQSGSPSEFSLMEHCE